VQRYLGFQWLWLVAAVAGVAFGASNDWGLVQWGVFAFLVVPGLVSLFNFIGTQHFLSQLAEMNQEQRETALAKLDNPLKPGTELPIHERGFFGEDVRGVSRDNGKAQGPDGELKHSLIEQ
jgi:hypothetical protein